MQSTVIKNNSIAPVPMEPTPVSIVSSPVEEKATGHSKIHTWFKYFQSYEFCSEDPEAAILARILSRTRVVAENDPRVCPTMAVGLRKQHYVLMYHPPFVEQASYQEILQTLVHEAMHIYMLDIPRFLKRMSLFEQSERPAMHRLLNVALDAANNSLMTVSHPSMKYGLTGYWVLPTPMKMPEKKSAEFYFDILLRQRDALEKEMQPLLQKMLAQLGAAQEGGEDSSGAGQGEGDEGEGQTPSGAAKAAAHLAANNAHDWLQGELENITAEELSILADGLEAATKSLVTKALQEHKKAIGKLPVHHQQHLDALLGDSDIPWHQVLANRIRARMLSKHRPTMQRPNKKNLMLHCFDPETQEIMPLPSPLPVYPGKKKDRRYVMLYAIDTSGSMSNDEIALGLGRLQGLLREYPDSHCIVVQCDTHISDIHLLDENEDVKSYLEKGRTSWGGTSFDEPFQLARYINGVDEMPNLRTRGMDEGAVRAMLAPYRHVDVLMYHTDGEGYLPKEGPPCPVLWCLTEGRAREPYCYNGQEPYGLVIHGSK